MKWNVEARTWLAAGATSTLCVGQHVLKNMLLEKLARKPKNCSRMFFLPCSGSCTTKRRNWKFPLFLLYGQCCRQLSKAYVWVSGMLSKWTFVQVRASKVVVGTEQVLRWPRGAARNMQSIENRVYRMRKGSRFRLKLRVFRRHSRIWEGQSGPKLTRHRMKRVQQGFPRSFSNLPQKFSIQCCWHLWNILKSVNVSSLASFWPGGSSVHGMGMAVAL